MGPERRSPTQKKWRKTTGDTSAQEVSTTKGEKQQDTSAQEVSTTKGEKQQPTRPHRRCRRPREKNNRRHVRTGGSLGRQHLLCRRVACCFSPLVVDTSCADVLPVVFLPWSSTPPLPTCCLLFFSLGRQHLLCRRVACCFLLTTKGEKQQATRRQRRC